MSIAFTRQLGAAPGVQLNPLRDDSELAAGTNGDQRFAIMGRFLRGRIDKPFVVNRGNVRQKLGKGEPIRVNALNLAWVQVVEALNNGAYEAVIQRLAPAAAVIKWVVAVEGAAGAVTWGCVNTIDVIDGPLLTDSGAPILDDNDDPIVVESANLILAVRHLECHNDGIQVEFHADPKRVSGADAANDRVTVRVRDADGAMLYEFYGSMDPSAVDDYGNSLFLPDVVSAQSDAVVVEVGSGTTIPTNSDAYGYDANGRKQWASSGVQIAFSEGGTTYLTDDLVAAREKLQHCPIDFNYLASGGSESSAVLAQLAQLAHDTNRQLRFDVPGDSTVTEAIEFIEGLGFDGQASPHLLHAFWCPVQSDDPTGVNGTGYYGAAALNIAYACGRNAATNAKGFAAKNYPIAGRDWPMRRTRMAQAVPLSDQDRDALAATNINPVAFDSFTGGGRYVFQDSKTLAPVENSLKMLISVVDMSAAIDDAVTRFGKDVLQLPMHVAEARMTDFLDELFAGAEASGWLVPSTAPEMGGRAWKHEVKPNAARPYDRLDVSYWLRYDGATRQIFVTQTLSR